MGAPRSHQLTWAKKGGRSPIDRFHSSFQQTPRSILEDTPLPLRKNP
jgi:hypothetical protein